MEEVLQYLTVTRHDTARVCDGIERVSEWNANAVERDAEQRRRRKGKKDTGDRRKNAARERKCEAESEPTL